MNKRILHLAVPNIISNITVPLVGMVDLAMMGHLDSVDYIAAIALGGMIFNFLYWGFGFLRMGTSGFTAQAYGKRNLADSIHTLARSLLMAILGALVLISLQYPIAKIAFWILKSEPEVELLAQNYFYIRIWAAPATIAMYAITGWYIGMQNTRFPLYIALVVNILNVLLNYIFVFIFHMGSDGVALGTVLAQYSGLIVALLLFKRYYYSRLMNYFTYKALKDLRLFIEFANVNKDIFIRTLCIIFVFTFFTSSSASVNKNILAVNTLLLQLFFIYSFFVDGFAYAAEALTGRYIGAKNPTLLHSAIRLLFRWGLGIGIGFTIAYAFSWQPIIKLMSDNENIIQIASEYAIWVIAMPILAFPSFLWDGIYIGATASAQMRNSMLIATIGIFIPIYMLLSTSLENHALWIALLAFLFVRGIAQYFMAPKAVYAKIYIHPHQKNHTK